jgi:hypothetical protein
MTSDDLAVVESQPGVHHLSSNHRIRRREKMLVMTVCTTKRDNGGDGIAASTCASRPLLVASPGWWNIAKRYAGQFPNIYSHFHCGGAGKDING